ncbi:MAG: class I SAM-dependent methyltransferase [Magnetococcus sp. YQC-5]
MDGQLVKPENYNFDALYSADLAQVQMSKFLLRRIRVGDLCHWHDRIQFFLDELVERLDRPKNAEYLDLGCQIGTFAIELGSRGYSATGVDLSQDALKVAQLLADKQQPVVPPKFVHGDISVQGLFPPESFDVIMAEDIFEHLHQDVLAQTIQNCAVWLRPGGFLVYHTHPTKYDYLFHSRGWKTVLSLIPLAVLSLIHGERKFKWWVEWYHKYVMNPCSRLKTGKTHEERILHQPHCNLLTLDAVEKMLRQASLIALVGKTDNFYKNALSRKRRLFFGDREYYHRNLYGIAWKPYRELLT